MSHQYRYNASNNSVSRTARNDNRNQDDDSDEAILIFIKFVLILIVVIFPLEVLLLSIGYTFTPWFFFLFLLAAGRTAAAGSSRTATDDVRDRIAAGGRRRTTTRTPHTQRLRREDIHGDRTLVPTADEELDDGVVEPFWTLKDGGHEDTPASEGGGKKTTGNQDKNESSAIDVDEEDVKTQSTAAETSSDEGRTPTMNQTNVTKDFSLPGPSSSRHMRVPNKKRKEEELRVMFRDAVDQAHFKTTEVDSDALSKKSHVIKKAPINGIYEIEYELVVKSSSSEEGTNATTAAAVVLKNTIDMHFKRGFCGWNIRGSRPAPSVSDNHDELGALTGGDFRIQRGFLAQTGNIYWEERGAFVPSFNILVGGKISSTSSFAGHWLSSASSEDGKLRTGRVIKFARLCNEEKEVAIDIV